MSFAEDLSYDFASVFANAEEFGVLANVGGKEVSALRVDVLEMESFGVPEHNALVLDVSSVDVPYVDRGTEIVLEGTRYVVSSLETKDGVTRIVGGRR